MDNKLLIFSKPEYGKIRVIGDPDNPLFCLSDVCKALGLRVDGVVARLKEDTSTAGVLSKHPVETAGGVQQMYFVTEQGLYDVVLDSRKPEAKKFRNWLTGEVAVSIRKTGSYTLPGATVEINDRHSVPNAAEISKELKELALLSTNSVVREQLIIESANYLMGGEYIYEPAELMIPRKKD